MELVQLMAGLEAKHSTFSLSGGIIFLNRARVLAVALDISRSGIRLLLFLNEDLCCVYNLRPNIRDVTFAVVYAQLPNRDEFSTELRNPIKLCFYRYL